MKREAEDVCFEVDQSSKKVKELSRAHSLGLTEFINHGFSPITGEIKTRMEDFLVTEIDISGVKRVLKSFDIPEQPMVERNLDVKLVDLSDCLVSDMNLVLDGTVKFFKIPAPSEKDKRTALHKSVASFSDQLSTETVKEGNVSFVKVSLKKKSSYNNRDRNSEHQFLHFTLLKWNITTTDAVLRLSKILKTKSSNITYGGLKDKRGITSQRMCCRFMAPNRLAGLNKPVFEANKVESDPVAYRSNFLLGDFEFHKEDLKLGELTGNAFTLILRDCQPTTEENLSKLRTLLLQNGFINYFGLQRFGNTGNTHQIGRCILNKDFLGAVNMILTSNDNQKPNVSETLKHFKSSGFAKSAFEMLEYKNSVEGILLGSLAKEATDFKRALKSLHYKQQTLYTHAYQSYIWNRLASKRIQCHGTQVLEGDLVLKSDKTVRKLTADEVPTTQFSEVVLPLPGYDIELPDNEYGGFLKDILQEDDMSLETFSGSIGREFNLGGCYRNILFKPSNFNSEVYKYSEENEKLALTNLDTVLKKKFEAANAGDKIAICLKFSLPKSCYATMLLREISRDDNQ